MCIYWHKSEEYICIPLQQGPREVGESVSILEDMQNLTAWASLQPFRIGLEVWTTWPRKVPSSKWHSVVLENWPVCLSAVTSDIVEAAQKTQATPSSGVLNTCLSSKSPGSSSAPLFPWEISKVRKAWCDDSMRPSSSALYLTGQPGTSPGVLGFDTVLVRMFKLTSVQILRKASEYQ